MSEHVRSVGHACCTCSAAALSDDLPVLRLARPNRERGLGCSALVSIWLECRAVSGEGHKRRSLAVVLTADVGCRSFLHFGHTRGKARHSSMKRKTTARVQYLSGEVCLGLVVFALRLPPERLRGASVRWHFHVTRGSQRIAAVKYYGMMCVERSGN